MGVFLKEGQGEQQATSSVGESRTAISAAIAHSLARRGYIRSRSLFTLLNIHFQK
jgi:hypothetical protein